MAIPGENADLYRRIKLYLFGFIIGIVVVSFIYKGRSCRLPSSIKLDELNAQRPVFTDKAKCQLKCLVLTEKELLHVLTEGSVNYTESDVHRKPYATYAVESTIPKNNQDVRVIIEDRDTLSEITSIELLSTENNLCLCE